MNDSGSSPDGLIMNMTTEEFKELLARRGQMLAKDGRTIIPMTKNPVLANAMELPKKKSKYGNKSVMIDCIRFPSRLEGNRYMALKAMVEKKECWFVRQVPFDLGGGVKYVCDFMVFYPDGRIEVEDAKGFKTQTYINKRKQVEALYPIKVKEIKK